MYNDKDKKIYNHYTVCWNHLNLAAHIANLTLILMGVNALKETYRTKIYVLQTFYDIQIFIKIHIEV